MMGEGREGSGGGGPAAAEPSEVRVLVVDDEPHNREFLTDVLEGAGYEVATAGDGPSALERVAERAPDVVLLDVMMPGMTGLEVCRELKGNEATAHVPVLMVTALSEREDRLRGIDAGADDFLRKPVDRHEVLLRVRNAARGKRLYDELAEKYAELQRLEALRDGLVRMLVHDMRTPLTSITANLELLETSLGEGLPDDAGEDLEEARAGSQVLADMVSQILVVSRGREEELALDLERAELRDLVEEAMKPLRSLARDRRLEVELPDEPVPLVCDPGLVRRTMANLFGNAVKFTPKGGSITVRARKEERLVRLEVEDTGPGIPPEEQERIFEEFFRGSRQGSTGKEESTGLGLTFCRMAVEAHGGRIGVESRPGEGSLFRVELPLEP